MDIKQAVDIRWQKQYFKHLALNFLDISEAYYLGL